MCDNSLFIRYNFADSSWAAEAVDMKGNGNKA